MRAVEALVILVCVTVGWPGAARAVPRAMIVVRAPGSDTFRPPPVDARLGEVVEAAVVLVERDGSVLAPPTVARVALENGRAARIAGAWPDSARVVLVRVEPRLLHVDTPPPNAGEPAFSNSVLFGPRHGTWLGYDTLEYVATPFGTEPSVTLRDARPTTREHDTAGGAGALWVAARVSLPDGTELRTPDETSRDRLGLSARVARVTFRTGDDYLGWLSTYFNVPNLFGSQGSQVDRWVGADCADVLVGALRASGQRVRYASVAGIGGLADALGPELRLGEDAVVRDADGAAHVLRWGSDVRPGDLVAIDYTDDPTGMLPRAWDHIGALVRDSPVGQPGVLDGADVLRHVTGLGLRDQPLRSQGAIRIRLWRFRVPARATHNRS